MAKFSDIVGQEEIKAELKSAIDNNHISNAYIIQGENRSGKEYVAKVFAQALVCEKLGECTDGSMNEACGECKACHQAASMNHPDIIYVRHEKPNSIGIDDVREGIIDTVFIKPYSAKYKIYILEEAEKLTPQAQNALLKTIEEPPEYVVFLILTSTAEALLPTIISRCVTLSMKPVRDDEMRAYLIRELNVSDSRAEICIAFARGNLGRAKALATSEDFDKIRVSALSLLMNHLIFRDEISSIQKVAAASAYEGIEEVIGALDTAKTRLKSSVDYELTMELLMLTIKENVAG